MAGERAHSQLTSVGPRLSLGILLLVVIAPASSAFHVGTPVVRGFSEDGGYAWAVAIRSHDEPTSYQGNELVLTVWGNGSYERSIVSIGILELGKTANGHLTERTGGIGTVFRGDDEVRVEPFGELPGSSPSQPIGQIEMGEKEESRVLAKERRFMDPGEWRYFVVWVGGSERSTFQVRGEGFTIEKVVRGEGHALGNDELVNGGGLYAQKSAGLPGGTSWRGEGHLGAGVAAISDTGANLETQAPLLGMFTEYHVWDVCPRVPISGCLAVGGKMNHVASQAQEGGFANFSMDIPASGHVWNKWNFYWLSTSDWGDASYDASTPGTYRFQVDHLTDVSGPSYREPVAGQGARLDGEQLVLSLAEVDYTELEGTTEG